MNTPRLLLFGLFLPPHTYLPSREQNVLPEVFFFECWASLGNHGYIPVSKPRSFFALLTDVVIGLLLNVTYYMPFLLPDAPHRTDYSQSEGDQKHFFFFTIINLFPKRLSRNQSINQSLYLCQYVVGGVAPIIRANGSCMEHMTKHIMDFLYFSFPLTNNFSNH